MKKKIKLEEYFKNKSLISKDDFESAISLFMILVLFREEDKENKIKYNHKNIVNYLKSPDLWDKNIYYDKRFNENLFELKLINIQISQILFFIDIKEEDISEVHEYIERKNKLKEFENINLEEIESSGNDFESSENDSEYESEDELITD